MIKYEFHIAKKIRDKFKLNAELFSLRGGVIFENREAIGKLAREINSEREADKQVTTGELYALGLLDEIIHYVIQQYDEKINPRVMAKAVEKLKEELSEDNFNNLLLDFIANFPPLNVYLGRQSAEQFLSNFMDYKSNVEIATEEMILLYLENFNPAAKKLKDLFDENYLFAEAEYFKSITALHRIFEDEVRLGPEMQDLLTFLKTPLIKHPDDLLKQLEYIEKNWKFIIGEKFTERILKSKEIFAEEAKYFAGGWRGKAPTLVPKYKGAKGSVSGTDESAAEYLEEEKFTPDVDWMPNVVLIAKNTFVWLDQLSKKYGREIKRLDQIPDEELDILAARNINSLWLIGIWERSSASKKIKHLTGNIDAVASAYSLYDYQIAAELGGEEAYENLNARAKSRGIRLASDMVPNHTGIYSDWVINHPDYFIQRSNPPYPAYSFNGADLSEHPDIEIKIEDGYYSKMDAAVVFQWRNKKTGETRYIYHGNDGTNMPWNDTAQLDMLKAEVREAVIQKIFEVADKFSIIRFDAAMTLAKRHFKRLWYPEPGSVGDIPSRSEFAMTQKEFDKLFPKEFWREVVDRINAEKPDTLLLAEAFWLMEGYFVRTLGMHRVYNSAFMHMMMNEENEKYRDLITNTLEFDPDILKRYVNFMSNPDEETAIKQFGTGDKYFGVCLLMVTLPGLPMFAHGQIEGFTEKYGMEYKRAYYDEQPLDWLVETHERKIFPLLAKRYLFSEVENFWFYDFTDDYGAINENVFVFTNKFGGEKALVLYNNKYDRAFGHVKQSTPKLNKKTGVKETVNVWTEFSILPGSDYFYIAKELTTNKEYLFSGEEICCDGFVFTLDGFQHNVFYGFTEVYDSEGLYRRLYNKIKGAGVDSVEKELLLLKLEPVHSAFLKIFAKEQFGKYVKAAYKGDFEKALTVKERLISSAEDFFKEAAAFGKKTYLLKSTMKEFDEKLQTAAELNIMLRKLPRPSEDITFTGICHTVKISLENSYKENLQIVLLKMTLEILNQLAGENAVEKLLLDDRINEALRHTGRGESGIEFEKTLVEILVEKEISFTELTKFEFVNKSNGKFKKAKEKEILKAFYNLLQDGKVQKLVNKHYYNGIVYYSKENFEDLVDWLFTVSLLDNLGEILKLSKRIQKDKRFFTLLRAKYLLVGKLKEMSVNSAYMWDKFLEKLKKEIKAGK